VQRLSRDCSIQLARGRMAIRCVLPPSDACPAPPPRDGADGGPVMTAKQRTLPRGTPYDERAIALARRLGISIPPLPLNHEQCVTLWVEIGKALLPFEPPEPSTLRQLWAEVGMFLAEAKEPEFAWGRGRRPGCKNKVLAAEGDLTPSGRWRRRSRSTLMT
jgi:hypothetical protein